MAESHATPTAPEEWQPIPDWEGLYEVSNHGRVRSLDRMVRGAHGSIWLRKGRIRKLYTEWSGHMTIKLRVEGKGGKNGKNMKVHQMVLSAFVGPPPAGHITRHLNGIPSDNRLENLSYGTYLDNLNDRKLHEGEPWKRVSCIRGHDLQEPNLVAHRKRDGERACLACSRARGKVRRKPDLKSSYQRIADDYFEEIMAP